MKEQRAQTEEERISEEGELLMERLSRIGSGNLDELHALRDEALDVSFFLGGPGVDPVVRWVSERGSALELDCYLKELRVTGLGFPDPQGMPEEIGIRITKDEMSAHELSGISVLSSSMLRDELQRRESASRADRSRASGSMILTFRP